jgi:hypothetical protein
MKGKITKWTIGILITLFLLYGFVYHTFIMLLLLVVVFGIGYLILKGGSNIFKEFDKFK